MGINEEAVPVESLVVFPEGSQAGNAGLNFIRGEVPW